MTVNAKSLFYSGTSKEQSGVIVPGEIRALAEIRIIVGGVSITCETMNAITEYQHINKKDKLIPVTSAIDILYRDLQALDDEMIAPVEGVCPTIVRVVHRRLQDSIGYLIDAWSAGQTEIDLEAYEFYKLCLLKGGDQNAIIVH